MSVNVLLVVSSLAIVALFVVSPVLVSLAKLVLVVVANVLERIFSSIEIVSTKIDELRDDIEDDFARVDYYSSRARRR